ncbi:efflux RND transporter periplasmic adaptor subunit [Salinarimonas soli]|uniref:Efflux RND transporter periplasmic adaptor subunit n=1 Tax=Salinarimonas soli TaxID=1638099 RepID=A0A5B2VI49_9HYPH|nr:efflux RND transporter periplasmic adaptor subunit [Salinarimonas soli]KAA2238298.1 efflux RND transporter periplasmic adaptor subunit [Salinarimonas soli]
MHSRPLLLGLSLAALLAACQEKPKEAAKPDRPVLVQEVAFEARVQERTFVATIRPRVETDLGFRVPGKVARRLVNAGDAVTAGQPLMVLDATDLRLQVEQAEAEGRAAEAALTQAVAELGRLQALRGQGWSTAAAYERQTAATEEARGRTARAERALSLARNALSYAILRADADGVVTAVLAEPGQVVAAGQATARVAGSAEKEAVVAIPEAGIGQLREAEASLTLWSSPDHRYEARLRELSASADPATRTYLARFALPGADDRVQLGMSATVTLREKGGDRIARLPLSALFNGGGGPAMWVVDADGRPALRPVEVAAYESRDVLVRTGLNPGDRVVTLGVQKLDAGQRVRIVQALEF